MNYDRPGLRERLAAEYVLGTMHGLARKRFQRLVRRSATMRAAVEHWERQLVPMAAPLSAPAPSDALWANIERRIAPAERSSTQASAPGFFARWFGVRQLGALAAGIVLGVAGMLIAPMLAPPPQQTAQLPASYAGFLADADGNTTMLVSSLRHGVVVDVKVLRPVTVPDHKRLVLWAVPRGGAPFAVGVVPGTGKGSLRMSGTSEQLLSNVTELAVSVEAREGALPSAPSGAFLLKGPCAKFW